MIQATNAASITPSTQAPTESATPQSAAEILTKGLLSDAPAQAKSTDVKVETKVEAPLEEKKPLDLMGPKFAALAKKERELQKKEALLREQSKPYQDFEKLKANAKNDPESYLKAVGLTYDDLTEFYLSGKVSKDAHVRELERRIQEAEEREKKRQEELSQAEKATAATRARAYVKEEILKAGEKFELVNATEAHEDVCDLIVSWHEQNGVELTIEEAAQKIESYLEQKFSQFKTVKKLPSLLGILQQQAKIAEEAKPSTTEKQSKTLTNSDALGETQTQRGPMTRDEEIALAARMLST